MVAYNFQRTFVVLIRAGLKRQTVRGGARARHPEPGQRIQLYVGQRSPACQKIIADPVCAAVTPVLIRPTGPADGAIALGSKSLSFAEAAEFAIADGFCRCDRDGVIDLDFSLACFRDFFRVTHGEGVFAGHAIFWDFATSAVSASQDLFAAA